MTKPLPDAPIPRRFRQATASALSALLALLPCAPAFAQDAKPERNSLQAVDVSPDQVTLKLTTPAKYNTFVTANPPRLVLELLNTDTELSTRVIEGRGKVLKRVRVGQFAGEPNPIARIVLDLNRAVNYRVGTSGADLTVRLELGTAGEEPSPEAKAPEPPVEPPAAVPEVKPEAKAPEPKAPEPKAPEVKLPEVKAPEIKTAAKPEAKPEPAPKAEPAAAAPAKVEAPAKAPAAVDTAPQAAPEAPEPAASKPKLRPIPASRPAPAAAAPEYKPFSTETSNEVVEMGTARRGADIVLGPGGFSVAQGVQVRHKRDIMATLPRDPIPSFDVDDVDVRDVMRMLASRANINLVYGPEVSGSMSIHLEKVPFSEAFNIVLAMNKLVAWQIGDNILQITTPEGLAKSREKQIGITRIFPVYYGKADEMKAAVDAVRSAEGRKGVTTVDVKNNALIVTETPEGLSSVERLLGELDTRPRQVLIEAKLVEVKLNKDLSLGIQWQYLEADAGKALGKEGTTVIGGAAEPASLSVQPFNKGATISKGGTGVTLPAASAFGALTLGRVTNNYFLSATLTAAASQGKLKVLSDPKIATLNGKSANINITNQIPYNTSNVTPTGVVTTNVAYITTGIQMKVKPTINADGRITLEVAPTVSQPTIAAPGAAPGVDSRNADTTVVVKDGETIVIGGLITDSVSNTENKIPLLGDLPILGWLFKRKTIIRSRVELLIFVTPKIMPD